ncbi:hypothetical protein MVI27_02710 [Chryseobacterium salipaludis]|uniref:hypothetical protein n=1 Tax=Chryseobacterium TaxID=59732 RepID=UPI001FF3144D|nr:MULTISPECIES: hypothetical protein [Chryseobacterium]MCJ8497165.1 hypothetical protein [Chryseobacterium salipaludis]MCX3296647.1 hypothetical protein [Planobacterium sp. JC490]
MMKQKDTIEAHRFYRCTRISLFRHPAPGTTQSLKPPISPGLRKRRRLKIGNYFRKEIYLFEWWQKLSIEGKFLFPPEFMNFRIRFKISAEFPVLDFLVRLHQGKPALVGSLIPLKKTKR